MMGLRVAAVTALAALANVARGPDDWLVRMAVPRVAGSAYL